MHPLVSGLRDHTRRRAATYSKRQAVKKYGEWRRGKAPKDDGKVYEEEWEAGGPAHPTNRWHREVLG